jgi:hypothetical protein
MTNRIAIWMAGILALAFAVDIAITGGELSLALARKTLALLEWMAFWR